MLALLRLAVFFPGLGLATLADLFCLGAVPNRSQKGPSPLGAARRPLRGLPLHPQTTLVSELLSAFLDHSEVTTPGLSGGGELWAAGPKDSGALAPAAGPSLLGPRWRALLLGLGLRPLRMGKG